jgi:hypothetical protein
MLIIGNITANQPLPEKQKAFNYFNNWWITILLTGRG